MFEYTPPQSPSSTERELQRPVPRPVRLIVLTVGDADRFLAEAVADPDYSTEILPYYGDRDGVRDEELVRVIVTARRVCAEFVGIAPENLDADPDRLCIEDTAGRVIEVSE